MTISASNMALQYKYRSSVLLLEDAEYILRDANFSCFKHKLFSSGSFVFLEIEKTWILSKKSEETGTLCTLLVALNVLRKQ